MLSNSHMVLIFSVTDIKHCQSIVSGHMACVGGMFVYALVSCVTTNGKLSASLASVQQGWVDLSHIYEEMCFVQACTHSAVYGSLWAELPVVTTVLCVYVCMCTGGMPAPEQSPVTEEGLLLTIHNSSAGRKMEADSTANNILASVKEQVGFDLECSLHPVWLISLIMRNL